MSETKSEMLTFRVSKQHRDAMRKKASEYGLTLAGYIRYIIIQDIRKGG